MAALRPGHERRRPRPLGVAPWIAGPPWYLRLLRGAVVVSCLVILDPARAVRICAGVLNEYIQDGD